ncbi:hypothetical protein HG530_002525 [Fusarium avenaceum]|nr:hypothetical protein HG530_002525 [Fusarium avenaceum]
MRAEFSAANMANCASSKRTDPGVVDATGATGGATRGATRGATGAPGGTISADEAVSLDGGIEGGEGAKKRAPGGDAEGGEESVAIDRRRQLTVDLEFASLEGDPVL